MGSQYWRTGSKSALLCLVFLAAVHWTAMANTEGDALYALRQSLIDPLQVLQSWDPALVNPCTWYYVTCNVENHVTRVDLANFSLSGNLVPQLGELSSLQYLEMYNNNISGQIPPSLGQLQQLTGLRFDSNQLTGTIPLSLTGLSKLKFLNLSRNNLIGDIPVTGSFANFTYESFEGNPGLHYAYAPAPAPSLGA